MQKKLIKKNYKKAKQNHTNSQLIKAISVPLTIFSLVIGALFISQMYWIMKNSEITTQIHRLEKNYQQLVIENQKKLIEINQQTQLFNRSKLQFNQYKKINIKNIPIVSYY